jgi:ABC-2 type transport system ATP-binding protein
LSESGPAIAVRALTKSYGSLEAVRGIDLTVDFGEVFALLGPNGAGKTTTVEILEGFRQPTSGEVQVLGLDPGARRHAWQMVRNLKDLGKTVLLTTHYMEEAQVLADRVAVIVDGRIVAEGRPDDLGGDDTGTQISVQAPDGPPPALTGATRTTDGEWRLVVDDPVPVLRELTSWAMDGGHALPGLQVHRRSLEDVYLELTAAAERPAESSPGPAGSGRRRRRR